MDSRRREILLVFGRALLILPITLALWFAIAAPLGWLAGKVALFPIRVISGGSAAMQWEGREVLYTVKLEMPYRPGGVPRIGADVQVNPGKYTYGMALFLALVLAARESRRKGLGILFGLVALSLLPSIGIAFDTLKQLGSVEGMMTFLRWSPATSEFVALGYQVGSLLLPTLVPAGLWLHLARGLWSREPAAAD